MPLRPHTSVTHHERALALFTDRFSERMRFARYVHSDPPIEQVLFLHGDGGNGKSLLLKLLRSRYCRRLPAPVWQELETQHDDRALTAAFERDDSAGNAIPCIYHDFDREDAAEDSPREAWSALMMLRRELGAHKIKLPSFDFAVMRYLHAGRQLSGERIKTLFPAEEAAFVSQLVDVVTDSRIPVAGLIVQVLGLFDRHLRTRIAMWQATWKLDEQTLQAIHRLDPKGELPDRLPHLLGADLNSAMRLPGAPVRLVLMFDTHEAFWGTERHVQSTHSYFQRDEWLRRLLSELYRPNTGVIVVVAGRERPRWDEAPECPLPATLTDTQLIGHLSRADAKDYLNRAFEPLPFERRAAEALMSTLIDNAELEAEQVHPLYLGLAADVVLAARENGESLSSQSFDHASDHISRGRALITRLLKYCSTEVEHAVTALATARGFDRSLFFELGAQLHLGATAAGFDTLRRFSFIWRDPALGHEWYRVHGLLARLLEEIHPESTQEAHAALEALYRARAKDDRRAIVEAIYHANRQDWRRGIDEWKKVCAQALRYADYDLCDALVHLRPVLRVETLSSDGLLALHCGDVALMLSRHQIAAMALEDAAAAYDAALKETPDDGDAYNNKGNALSGLGYLRATLSDHAGAMHAYEQAIAAHDAALALTLTPDHGVIYINKGIALTRLGQLRASLRDRNGAKEAFERAIAAHDAASALLPDSAAACNNRGIALLQLGNARAWLSDREGAEQAIARGIEAYDAALVYEPDNIECHSNKAMALQLLAHLRASASDDAGAQQAYEQAIATHDLALARAPGGVVSHNNKGNTLRRLAELHAKLGDHAAAQQSFEKAIAAHDAALERAPDFVHAHIHKGDALHGLGQLRSMLSDHAGAQATLDQALTSYEAALARAPDDVKALVARGLLLWELAESECERGDTGAACRRLREAQALLERAVAVVPDVDLIDVHSGIDARSGVAELLRKHC